ncbi:MAG: alpha,alpha-trehalase [Candidatus Omnitrophica bacterium]|nr:alpha,alpha-trehalase [Candidatus Omnitrophota bacterium]MCM8824708.1 alpha,alpha-trehalase [Candidatus Omnitrophota bacterium]
MKVIEMIAYWKKIIDDATHKPEYPFEGEWISFGNLYPVKGLGGWETPVIAHEIAQYDPDRAKHLIIQYLKTSMNEDDGMLAAKVVTKTDALYPSTERGRIYKYSHPPVWNFIAKKIVENNWDEKFALFCFESGLKNLKWWEENRKDRIGLYWYFDSFPDEKDSPESGYEHSPRWDFTELGPFPCIDLSCQILLYMESMIFFADKLNRKKEKSKITASYQELKTVMTRYFWDEIVGAYCDYDLTGMNAKKTTASFWSLTSGLASADDAQRLVSLLENPEEFAGAKGIPAVSFSEPKFELDFWRGCMWPSETFWICVGLQRYGFNDLTVTIAKKCIENVYSVFKSTGKLWEFYNPVDGNMKTLRRKKSRQGPFPDYPASVPVISLEKMITGEKI